MAFYSTMCVVFDSVKNTQYCISFDPVRKKVYFSQYSGCNKQCCEVSQRQYARCLCRMLSGPCFPQV